MSKDMLGAALRAAVGVPQSRLDLLAKIASKFAGDNPDGEAWHTHIGTAVKNGLPKVEVPNLLRPVIDITVGPFDGPFVPCEFFRDRSGLYVWNDFEGRMLVEAPVVLVNEAVALRLFDLTRNVYDREILFVPHIPIEKLRLFIKPIG